MTSLSEHQQDLYYHESVASNYLNGQPSHQLIHNPIEQHERPPYYSTPHGTSYNSAQGNSVSNGYYSHSSIPGDNGAEPHDQISTGGSPQLSKTPNTHVIPPQPIEKPVEQPFYVNAKQYHRILKRRIARARLEETLKIARTRKPYLHESRHKHAMRRPRGQGGRFLTAAELAEMEKAKKLTENNDEGQKIDGPKTENELMNSYSRSQSITDSPKNGTDDSIQIKEENIFQNLINTSN